MRRCQSTFVMVIDPRKWKTLTYNSIQTDPEPRVPSIMYIRFFFYFLPNYHAYCRLLEQSYSRGDAGDGKKKKTKTRAIDEIFNYQFSNESPYRWTRILNGDIKTI